MAVVSPSMSSILRSSVKYNLRACLAISERLTKPFSFIVWSICLTIESGMDRLMIAIYFAA